MRLHCTALLAASVLGTCPLVAQTAGGKVVSFTTGQPLRGVRVLLTDDSARVVVQSVTDSVQGAFFLDAPRPARYRIALIDPKGGTFVSPPFRLDSGETRQALYSVPDLSGKFAGYRFRGDVSVEAKPIMKSLAVRYPTAMRRNGVDGAVTLAFLVDSAGRVDPDRYEVILATNEEFAGAVRTALLRGRFEPAMLNGQPVSQVINTTFHFGAFDMPRMDGVAVRGDGRIGPGSARRP